MEPQLVRHFSCVHGVWQVLFIGEAEEHRITQLVLVQHAHQLFARFVYPLSVIAVHHEDQTLGVLKVVPPERSDFVLTTDIPYGEAEKMGVN